jgi:3-deoxy-D-manno-octulosonic-acid transferase
LRQIYTLFLYLLTPFILLRLLWRGFRSPAYWRRWKERFGYLPFHVAGPSIWIHAVSVGEAQAATPLVSALLERYPQRPIVVTTTTPTGSERVREAFGDAVLNTYICYDTPGMVRRFLDQLRPSVAIVMESEIWPNLFLQCEQRGVPLLIVNARLSPQSTMRYQRLRGLTRETLAHVTAVATQSDIDAERYVSIGMAPARIHQTGSIKFDVKLPVSIKEQAAVMRRDWGVNRSVWIAASTHEGEEDIILRAYDQVRRALPNALLVLVPRHPERFTRVASLCRKQGYSVVLRSENRPCGDDTSVLIGDSMGELVIFYAASDVAFVGGTLVLIGGHNILEPAALGIPVLTGPYLHNFEEISQMLIAAGACIQINDEKQLANTVIRLLRDADLRFSMGEKGRRVVEENRGALDSVLDLIAVHIGPAQQEPQRLHAAAVNEH